MNFILVLTALLAMSCYSAADELQVEHVTSLEGDGPDGIANTDDDTWGFWFALAHDPSSFRRLTRHSTSVPREGIPGKIHGPIANMLPNPESSTGWILHTDWDGRFEGVWGDSKSGSVLIHPYVEKSAHMAVSITYRIREAGTYQVSGGITDLQIQPEHPKHDGVIWIIDLVQPDTGKVVEAARGEPVGDGHGRPDSARFSTKALLLPKDTLVRLVIHPNKWWGQDLTRIDSFKIEKK